MKKVEFLRELNERLSKLPDYEIKRTLSFYSEIIEDRIEDGMDEEQAVDSLGGIDKITSDTLIDTPLSSLIQTKINDSRKKTKNQTLWIVLVVLGIPFWLPVIIAFLSALLSVYITVWAVVISLFAAEFSLAVVGIAGLITGLTLCVRADIITGLLLISMSFISAGLFIMTIKPLLWLCKQFLSLTGLFLIKVKSLFINK